MADPKYKNDWTTKHDLIEHELMGVIFEQIDAGYDFNDATVTKLLNGNRTTPAEIIKLCEQHDCLQRFARKVKGGTHD